MEVLEKSLNFFASPWKVLEFSSAFNVVAWKVFFNGFCFSEREYTIQHFLNVLYQFKTSVLKKCRLSLSLKVLLEWARRVQFCTICEITFLVGGPWKWNVVLGKFWKVHTKWLQCFGSFPTYVYDLTYDGNYNNIHCLQVYSLSNTCRGYSFIWQISISSNGL